VPLSMSGLVPALLRLCHQGQILAQTDVRCVNSTGEQKISIQPPTAHHATDPKPTAPQAIGTKCEPRTQAYAMDQ